MNRVILETPRLRLREISTDDAPFVYAILNEPAFIEDVGDRGIRTVADAEKYIAEKITASYAQHGFGFYIIELKTTGEGVGMCGLLKRPMLDDVDIGYSVLEKYWRNGYAFEAADALMKYGRTVLNLPRIVAITSLDNHKSANLLEKLGLRYERSVRLEGFATDTRIFV